MFALRPNVTEFSLFSFFSPKCVCFWYCFHSCRKISIKLKICISWYNVCFKSVVNHPPGTRGDFIPIIYPPSGFHGNLLPIAGNFIGIILMTSSIFAQNQQFYLIRIFSRTSNRRKLVDTSMERYYEDVIKKWWIIAPLCLFFADVSTF